MIEEAERLVEEGRALDDAGDIEGAERSYHAAAVSSPDWSVPHYNLGLLCKYASRWEESLRFNQKAAELAPDDQAAWWNLGIAATALSNWSEARRAWKACGLEPPGGEGPPEFHWGATPVRLDPEGDGEVVWAQRLDPARASILSVPLPSSPHNAGDVVLTDGAANGFRTVNGREYPVFDVLGLLTPSVLRKYVLELAASDSTAADTLERIAQESGAFAEDWGQTTNILCAKCSRGVPHEHASTSNRPAHPHCGLAARDDDHAESIIRSWLEREPKADLVRWYDAESAPPNEEL